VIALAILLLHLICQQEKLYFSKYIVSTLSVGRNDLNGSFANNFSMQNTFSWFTFLIDLTTPLGACPLASVTSKISRGDEYGRRVIPVWVLELAKSFYFHLC
jgi:hypothetical protein